MNSMLGSVSKIIKTHAKTPLVHCITNYVSMNEVANGILSVGGTPIMAEAEEEIEDITSRAQALVLNIGTLSSKKIDSILKAAATANAHHVPIVLDPVGIAISSFRKELAQHLLTTYKIDAVKGNISEIKTLLSLPTDFIGLDAIENDESLQSLSLQASQSFTGVAIITGKKDWICDGKQYCVVENGTEMLKKITGTGCLLAGVMGVMLGKSNDVFLGAAAGSILLNLAGEIAHSSLRPGEGTGTFRIRMQDALSTISPGFIEQKGRVHHEFI